MGIYGVEDDFWVDGYHFEVGFSNDNAVGLCQRDVTVGHRRSVEDLALSDFTGLQLLEAYTGPDRVMRQETLAHQVELLRASYKRGATSATCEQYSFVTPRKERPQAS